MAESGKMKKVNLKEAYEKEFQIRKKILEEKYLDPNCTFEEIYDSAEYNRHYLQAINRFLCDIGECSEQEYERQMKRVNHSFSTFRYEFYGEKNIEIMVYDDTLDKRKQAIDLHKRENSMRECMERTVEKQPKYIAKEPERER